MYQPRINRIYDNNKGHSSTNSQIIKYIYDSINLKDYKFKILEYERDLAQLANDKYMLAVNFSGQNHFLVFVKIRDIYFSCLINRETMSFEYEKVNINNVGITNVNIRLEETIYQGTILDGTLVQTKQGKTFIITDICLFKGKHIKYDISTKLQTIISYLNSNYDSDNKKNDIMLTVNKLYPITSISHVENNVKPTLKNMSIRGYCFYPILGSINSTDKLIFLYGNENRQSKQKIEYKKIIDNTAKHTFTNKYNPKILNDNKSLSSEDNTTVQVKEKMIIAEHTPEIIKIYKPMSNKKDTDYVFDIEYSDTDVYYLSAIKLSSKNKKTLIKVRIGLAYVPGLAESKFCRELIQQNNKKLLVKCRFHKDKNKWEPYCLAYDKRPSFIDTFDVINITK
jgi:hypothetical protein